MGNIKKNERLIELSHKETRVMKNGMETTIIAYRNNKDIDVQFKDGTIVTHRVYNNFKNGYIRNPNL